MPLAPLGHRTERWWIPLAATEEAVVVPDGAFPTGHDTE